jgi:hypothetical protein
MVPLFSALTSSGVGARTFSTICARSYSSDALATIVAPAAVNCSSGTEALTPAPDWTSN